MEKRKVIIVGAGGHAKVVMEAIDPDKYLIVGILDKDTSKLHEKINGVEIIGGDMEADQFYNQGVTCAVIAIGHIGNSTVRNDLFYRFKSIGYDMINVIHKTAIVSDNIELGQGNMVLAGAIINSGAVIMDNTIINTGVIVEHDAVIQNGVHLAPRTVIAGGTKIGENSFVGLGSVVIQGLKIGKNCIIGAGSTVIKDLSNNLLAVGSPARVIREV